MHVSIFAALQVGTDMQEHRRDSMGEGLSEFDIFILITNSACLPRHLRMAMPEVMLSYAQTTSYTLITAVRGPLAGTQILTSEVMHLPVEGALCTGAVARTVRTCLRVKLSAAS